MSFHESYPKYDIDIMYYDNYIYLSTTFRHNNKTYLISKSTYEKQLVQNMQLLGDLKNKDSILYSELL